MNNKVALITGITGQDGAYLAKCLLDKNYNVYGSYRRLSTLNLWRLKYLNILNHPNLKLVELDVTDLSNCVRLVSKIKPNEIYNLAAQSFVAVSFEQPILTSNVTGVGVLNMLESIRLNDKKIRFYQASTSEMFGKVMDVPQNENTKFYPRSPYGVSKLFGHWMTINYRESYNMFASSGILFNHESPLRGKEFVTRKITDYVSKIYLGQADCLELGNLSASRDWGYAPEYVEGMYLILQNSKPDNYVLATNKTNTVRDFVSMAFRAVDINIKWEGEGENEIGVNLNNNKKVVKVNPDFFRPCEVELLIGDASKAKSELSWDPVTSLEDLCSIMVQADLERNKSDVK